MSDVFLIDDIYEETIDYLNYKTEAKFVYALFLKYGFNKIDVNYNEAINYLNKAITEGYPPAMIELGEMYLNGTGMKSVVYKSAELFKNAFRYGITNPVTAYERIFYAKALIFGYNCEKNIDLAFELLSHNEIKLNPFAISLLAIIHHKKQNYKKANVYFSIALKNGDEFINNYVKNNNIIISLTDEEIIESIWDDF